MLLCHIKIKTRVYVLFKNYNTTFKQIIIDEVFLFLDATFLEYRRLLITIPKSRLHFLLNLKLNFMKKIVLLLVPIFILSCQSDFDDPSIQELLTSGTNPNFNSEETISNDDTLYDYLNLVSRTTDTELTDVGCIEFIYPFVLFQFDDEERFISQISVKGNEDFTSILNDLQDGFSISLSYPISGNLLDETHVTVNNNDELQESLETCIEEELEIIIGECNTIFTDESCLWRIIESDNDESPYIESFFEINDDGSVNFSVLDEEAADDTDSETTEEAIYNTCIGTWVFYYIGPDLHLNINFGPILENEEQQDNQEIDEKEQIKLDWNFDWKINYIDSDKIVIEKEFVDPTSENEDIITEIITLEKECENDSMENDASEN